MKRTPDPSNAFMRDPAVAIMISCLGKMEGALTFLYSNTQFLAENVHAAIIGHLEIVDTSHDAREVVVRRKWRLTGFANDCEHRSEILET